MLYKYIFESRNFIAYKRSKNQYEVYEKRLQKAFSMGLSEYKIFLLYIKGISVNDIIQNDSNLSFSFVNNCFLYFQDHEIQPEHKLLNHTSPSIKVYALNKCTVVSPLLRIFRFFYIRFSADMSFYLDATME